MPKLILYGPDRKHGARPKPRMRRYVWYITWHEGRRRRERSTGVDYHRRDDAEKELARFVLDLHRRQKAAVGPRDTSEIRIADVLSTYMEEHARTVADPARIAYAVKALLGYWGDRHVDAITGSTCRAYVRYRAAVSSGTVRRELGTLGAALRHSEREGYLVRAPVVILPSGSGPRERWLTRPEVAALIRAARKLPRASACLPLFILLGVYVGARSKAILSLQWQPNLSGGWVDLENGVIRWKQSGTKKRQPRVTPIPQKLMRLLRCRKQHTLRFVLEYHAGKQVFSLKKSWKALLQATGISDATPHTLRHTCGTWLAQRGVPMWELAGYLGMTVETASRVYLHHSPEHLRGAAEAIGRKA
jgi:integrase